MPSAASSPARSTKGASGIFDMMTRWSLYLLFSLIPLFFLPWTTTVLDTNKQMLLVVLTVVGVGAWLGQMVVSKRLSFRSGWLNLVPGLFLGVVLVSSILSLSGYQTWIGQASQEYMSFLSMAMFVLLFYLIGNTASETRVQRTILSCLLGASAVSGLVTLLGMFDVVHLPFEFAQSTGFNTVGTINSFVLYLSVVMFVGLAMWLVSHEGRDRIIPVGGKGLMLKGAILCIALVNLVALMAIDFWVFWVVNMIGVLLLGVFVFLKTQEFPSPRRFAIPLAVLFVSVLLLFLPSPVRLSLPAVVSPSYATSWDIAKTTLGVDTGNLLFGSGPGTYLYDYLAYKTEGVNASPFWSVRFDRAKSLLITMVASVGLLGTALWLGTMVWVGLLSLSRLVRERDHEEWKMTYVLFIGWAMLFVSALLYSSNLTMSFLLWSFTGLLVSQVMRSVWSSNFARSPRLGLGASAAFVFVMIGLLASLFFTGQRQAAEMAFTRAVGVDGSQEGSVEEVIALLERATELNPWSDMYQRNLSSALLVQARGMIGSLESEPTAEQTQAIVDVVTSAVAAANRATKIEPNYVANWVMRGSVYRDVMGFATGAEDLAAQSFLAATQLEPISPVHRTNLGRVYLTVADRARALRASDDPETAAAAAEQEASLLATAETAFTTAAQLKPDYLPAHYYLAATYERQGRLEQAVGRLVALRNNSLADVGIAFQLSQMLIRLEEYEAATQEHERSVGMNGEYSNALWYLASMYEIAGRQAEAIALVEQVLALNPENTVAADRLARMRAGEVTTVNPEPIQDGQGAVAAPDEGEIVEEGSVDSGQGTVEE